MKSHVSIEQKVCAICGKTNDSGAILLQKNLRQTLDQNTVTGYNHCEDCSKLIADQFLACIEISNKDEQPIMKLEDAIRTGNLVWIKKRVATQVFDKEIHTPLIFITHEVFDFFESLQAKAV